MINPDNDPNMAMSKLVARSRGRTDGNTPPVPAETPAAKPNEAQNQPSSPAPPAPPASEEQAQKLTKLFGKALRFSEKPAQSPPASPQTPSATPSAADSPEPGAPAASAAPPPATTPEPKPKKGTKKVQPAPVDPVALAREAATAATHAALQTLHKPPEPTDPTADMTAQDKRDFEIANHLAKTDPRYKDAPRIILEHVQMAENYASNWERANPGKVFDAGDEEHNEFYARLVRSWSPEEFTDAAVDMRAEQKLDARMKKIGEQHSAEMDDVKEGQGRVELGPAVEQRFTNAAMALAQEVDPAIHQALAAKGWDGLDEVDPVTAEVMTVTLQQMHPFIEAAIQLDDPHRRFRLDLKKPSHMQWNQVVSQGENNLVGTQLDDGRVFAKRADFARMDPGQQARHWYLTTDMIIQGAVEYAAGQVKTVSAQQTERLKKMGFVRQPQKPGSGNAHPQVAAATHAPARQVAAPPATAPDKPTSPTVGSGAKIDQPGGNPMSTEGKIINFFSKARGNP